MDKKARNYDKLIFAATTLRAVSTIAIVVVPIASITAAIIGYGTRRIIKKLLSKKTMEAGPGRQPVDRGDK